MKEINWANVKKTIDLNNLYNSATDYSQKNYLNMPIEKQFYFVHGKTQLCIHFVKNKYCVYGFNFQPKYFKDNHIELMPYKWEKLASFTNKENAIHCFEIYIKEIVKNEKRIELQDVINYLIELKKISGGIQ